MRLILGGQISTDMRDSLLPDCPFSADHHSLLMHTISPLTLTPEDKIDALRHLDEFHFWHALDDLRICQRCHQQITGWQIEVVQLAGTRGAQRLQCPTPDCESTPGEWIYADPVLAARMHNDYHPPRGGPRILTPSEIFLAHRD